LLAIASRNGVADPQFSIGQEDTWLLHEPHWQANLSATFLTSGVIISAGKDELNKNSINKAGPEALPRRHMKGRLMLCLSDEFKLNEPLLPLAKNLVIEELKRGSPTRLSPVFRNYAHALSRLL
jgi:hypothetical protein